MRGQTIVLLDIERAAREVQLGIELVKALQGDCNQFICEYQPQLEMTSGRVVGLEALIRWNHPTKGLLLPGHFLPALQQSSPSGPVRCSGDSCGCCVACL